MQLRKMCELDHSRVIAVLAVSCFLQLVHFAIIGPQSVCAQSTAQVQAGADALGGVWESEWGPLTFYAVPQRDHVEVTGYWLQQGNKGIITRGRFDPLTRLLTFTYYQHWNNVTGAAALTVSRDFQTLTGNWDQSNGNKGKWQLRRQGATAESSASTNSNTNSAAPPAAPPSTAVPAEPASLSGREAIIADFKATIDKLKEGPEDDLNHLNQAMIYLALGDSSSASKEAAQVLQMLTSISNPEDEHTQQIAVVILWLAYEKSGDKTAQSALLKQAETKCNQKVWPYTVLKYLAGSATESQVVAITGSIPQQAEGAFLVGMKYMCGSNFTQASKFFEKVISFAPNVNSQTNYYQELARRMLAILHG